MLKGHFAKIAFAAAIAAGVVPSFAEAEVLSTSFVRGAGGFDSIAVDPVLGRYYERPGNDGSGPVNVFLNQAAFEAGGAPFGTFSLQADVISGTFISGTYIAARSGILYGRSSQTDTAGAAWNATVGQGGELLKGANFSGMCGTNLSCTFDWGGFTAANWLHDNTGLYVLGRNSSLASWQLNLVNPDLTIASTKTINLASGLGFAVMINGRLYLGDTFSAGHISHVFDFATGILSDIDITLDTTGGLHFLSDALWDPQSDTAFFDDEGNIFKLANARAAFEAALPTAVPEPASMAILGVGILAIGLMGRRRKA